MPTSSATPYGDKYGVTDAQTAPATAQGTAAPPQRVRDPVCGMGISPGEAAASTEVDQKQKRYWFCSHCCEQVFLAKDPICGMIVDKATALATERGNRKYYFCGESHLRTSDSPESEMKAITDWISDGFRHPDR